LNETEKRSRLAVAQADFHEPLAEVAKHHSVEVMDHEVSVFLKQMPSKARILDIGGCWGWHWRKMDASAWSPRVILLDFVPQNFKYAEVILGSIFHRSVLPIEGDAQNLPFEDNLFDAVWTVQTFQHIRDFDRACREAWRVLKPGGQFINYSLYAPVALRLLYRIRGKNFHQEGEVPGRFYLRRADAEQKKTVETIFRGPVEERFTECLFHPDLRFTFSGKEGSLLGDLDAQLGAFPRLGSLIARQRSFFAVK